MKNTSFFLKAPTLIIISRKPETGLRSEAIQYLARSYSDFGLPHNFANQAVLMDIENKLV